MSSFPRLNDIDRAKGLAIILVVYGHLIANNFPRGNAWYEISNKMVYMFHMPFFMFISGVTSYYTYKNISSFSQYGSYAVKKLVRLMPAFFLFGLVILSGKILASYFLHVDNVPTNFWTEIGNLLIDPHSSVAGSLWYIYALFEILLIFPLLLLLFRRNLLLMAIILIPLSLFRVTSLFLFDTVIQFLPFFVLGALAVSKFEIYTKVVDKYKYLFVLLFCLSFIFMYLGYSKDLCKLIIGLCSIPALHGLLRTSLSEKLTFLSFCGAFTFSIYLLNTIFIGFSKGVLLKFTSWHNENFLWIAPILFVAGLMGPILAKKYVLNRIPIIDKITT